MKKRDRKTIIKKIILWLAVASVSALITYVIILLLVASIHCY